MSMTLVENIRHNMTKKSFYRSLSKLSFTLFLMVGSWAYGDEPSVPLKPSCAQQKNQCDLIGCDAFGKNSDIANRCHERWKQYMDVPNAAIKTYWACYHACLEQQKATLCSGETEACPQPKGNEPRPKDMDLM